MNILFVCSGNVARSQEAALYFNSLRKDPEDVATSAGIHAIVGKPINPQVVQTMFEDNMSMDGCYRKALTPDMVRIASHIISFVGIEELPDFVQSHPAVSFWDVPDPRHQNDDFHKQVRDDIKQRVIDLLREIEE